MQAFCFCALAALALGGCGGRVHDPRGSAAMSGAGGDAPLDSGMPAKPCTFKGFAPAVSYTLAQAPSEITGIDNSGAGTLDLALAEQDSDESNFRFELFVNAGNGTFTTQPAVGASDNFYGNLVSADFNGDGKIDIASQLNRYDESDGGTSGVLGVDFGTVEHAFAPTRTLYPVPFANSDLVAGDFDGDGRPDIAAIGYDFILPSPIELGLPIPVPADFTIAVLLNTGAGTLAAPVLYPTSRSLSQLSVGDFDGDGHLDLAALDNSSTSGFVVYFNQGGGVFRDPRPFPGADLWSTYGLGVADFDGDGKSDIASPAIINSNSPNEQKVLRIFNGQSDGTLSEPVNYPIQNVPSVYRVATGDFNGDGKPDVALVMGNGTFGAPVTPIPVSVFLNQGDGSLAAPTDYFVGDAVQSSALSFMVGELNGDGATDIAVTTTNIVEPLHKALNVLLSECE